MAIKDLSKRYRSRRYLAKNLAIIISILQIFIATVRNIPAVYSHQTGVISPICLSIQKHGESIHLGNNKK